MRRVARCSLQGVWNYCEDEQTQEVTCHNSRPGGSLKTNVEGNNQTMSVHVWPAHRLVEMWQQHTISVDTTQDTRGFQSVFVTHLHPPSQLYESVGERSLQ